MDSSHSGAKIGNKNEKCKFWSKKKKATRLLLNLLIQHFGHSRPVFGITGSVLLIIQMTTIPGTRNESRGLSSQPIGIGFIRVQQ